MKINKIGTPIRLIVVLFQLGWSTGEIYGAPPIQSEEAAQKETQEEKDKQREKTPEEKKKEKEDDEVKANVKDIRRRQENDEKSVRVRANIFPADSPEAQCTAADRARARLDEVTGDGSLRMGDVIIDSTNETNVDKNKGAINSQVNVNITNTNNKRC
ncbi:MAG: hypothetical protein HY282_12365 [Nitrospirae bacterium]|nr:hypothetical protein [Candidatus Manganitrophaceae bacterium]